MPFYTCIHLDGLLNDEARKNMARGITDVHCELTGAPRHFVHVIFQPYRTGDGYTGGESSKVVNLRGTIRQGRSAATKKAMLERLTELCSDICPDTSLGDIVVSLTENAATNVMEGGIVLPHPHDEAEWLSQHGFIPSTHSAQPNV